MEADIGGVVEMKRAEIDTRAPFKSVKEAVMLFGERVLAGEIYPHKHSENGNDPSKLGNVTTELEETKQSLQKAREESMVMATCLSSLQEELERTKRELQQLKRQESKKEVTTKTGAAEIDHEDLKFVEDSPKSFEVKRQQQEQITPNVVEGVEFQKKRYVTFANPPSLTKVMLPQGDAAAVLERHPSLRKKKKKPLIPLIGGIFSRKKCEAPEVPINSGKK